MSHASLLSSWHTTGLHLLASPAVRCGRVTGANGKGLEMMCVPRFQARPIDTSCRSVCSPFACLRPEVGALRVGGSLESYD